MRILTWIVRALVVLLLLRFLVQLLFGIRRQMGGGTRTARPPQGGGERAGGELVRDPQCGTYVARARAIPLGTGADTKYFCSAACRDGWTARQGEQRN